MESWTALNDGREYRLEQREDGTWYMTTSIEGSIYGVHPALVVRIQNLEAREDQLKKALDQAVKRNDELDDKFVNITRQADQLEGALHRYRDISDRLDDINKKIADSFRSFSSPSTVPEPLHRAWMNQFQSIEIGKTNARISAAISKMSALQDRIESIYSLAVNTDVRVGALEAGKDQNIEALSASLEGLLDSVAKAHSRLDDVRAFMSAPYGPNVGEEMDRRAMAVASEAVKAERQRCVKLAHEAEIQIGQMRGEKFHKAYVIRELFRLQNAIRTGQARNTDRNPEPVESPAVETEKPEAETETWHLLYRAGAKKLRSVRDKIGWCPARQNEDGDVLISKHPRGWYLIRLLDPDNGHQKEVDLNFP